MISCDGKFDAAIANLNERARKAFFAFRKHDHFGNANLSFKFFDSLVKPILLYGCEVITPFLCSHIKDTNFTSICESVKLEDLHKLLFRSILGISKKRKPIGVGIRGELGRFPLLIDALAHTQKFMDRIKQLDESHLVKLAFNESRNLRSTISWENLVKSIPNKLAIIPSNLNKSTLRDKYIECWKKSIEQSEKLEHIKAVKHEFILEPYVLCVPFSSRVSFTKLRTSTHDLEIELGRYKKVKLPGNDKSTKMPKELRLCNLCVDNSVESEYHFVMSCPYYAKLRTMFFSHISKLHAEFTSLSDQDKFLFILNCGHKNAKDEPLSKLICLFVNDLFESRKEFFSASEPTPTPVAVTTRSGRLSAPPRRYPS